MTIALSSMVLGMGLFTGCAAKDEILVNEHSIKKPNELLIKEVSVPKHQIKEVLDTKNFVYEYFEVSDNKNGQIHGGIIDSTENQTGEGIYLDETYHGYDDVKHVDVGDTIRITYKKEDYNNEIWDNIVEAEVIK
jgi:hypothetical protein